MNLQSLSFYHLVSHIPVVAVTIVITVDIANWFLKLVPPQCMLGLKRDSTGQMRAHQMLMHASISSVELLREISIWI